MNPKNAFVCGDSASRTVTQQAFTCGGNLIKVVIVNMVQNKKASECHTHSGLQFNPNLARNTHIHTCVSAGLAD